PRPREGSVDLPAPASVGLPAPAAVGLPAPSRRGGAGDGADLPVPRASHADLPTPRGADASFGDLGLPLPGGAAGNAGALDDDLALPPPAHPGGGVRGHGELDLGGEPDGPEDMEFADIPQASPGAGPDELPLATGRVS